MVFEEQELIIIFVPLSDPVTAGAFEITLILYAEPPATPAGIVPVIVPDVEEVKVPIAVGEAKDPAELDN